ncbi:MAG: hypothetical protein ACI4I3_02780, partial [Acutalibacteraceae bacterium]
FREKLGAALVSGSCNSGFVFTSFLYRNLKMGTRYFYHAPCFSGVDEVAGVKPLSDEISGKAGKLRRTQ